MNLSQEQMSSSTPIAMVVQAVVMVATAAVIAVVIAWSGANNIIEGIGVGVLLGVGLMVSDHTKLVAFTVTVRDQQRVHRARVCGDRRDHCAVAVVRR